MPNTVTTQLSLADRIAQDIQSGSYGPGAWLKQIDLQQRYGATRLEVRRALDQLAVKRLITHIANRGYHVYVTDTTRHMQIRDIRVILEVGAAADLIAHCTPEKLRVLRGFAERFQTLLTSGTLLEQYEINLEFHAAMYDMCANRELAALILEIRSRGPSAPAREWITHARIEKSAKEHFDIVAAIEARDVKRLQKLIATHVGQDIS